MKAYGRKKNEGPVSLWNWLKGFLQHFDIHFFFYIPLLPAGISIVLFNEPLMNSLTSMA